MTTYIFGALKMSQYSYLITKRNIAKARDLYTSQYKTYNPSGIIGV